MALTATMYSFEIALADVDRGVYEALSLRAAQHPSETVEHLLARVVAYCLEYEEGIAFSKGVSDGDEPAVLVRAADGRIKTWVEVGLPDADRLHKAAKSAERVAVYTHRDPRLLLRQLAGRTIHRAAEIPLYAIDPAWLATLAAALERRTSLDLSVTERQLYITVAGRSWNGPVVEHRLGGTPTQ
jgi:uncharacterized protein YaeQ